MVSKINEEIETMLYVDEWLSTYFQPKKAYKYVRPFDVRDFPEGFIYAKVENDNIDSLNRLISQGFNIVETSYFFEQQQCLALNRNSRFLFRQASKSDMESVSEIAQQAFVNSRFHQDKNISKELAGKIKRDWVRNYFSGNRGTTMIVCENSSFELIAFLLLINNTIDLIATSPAHCRQGVGLELLAFANQNIGLLKAGTQSLNQASIALYRKAGFVLKNVQFVFHKYI